MNRETKKKIKTAGAVLFVLYILALIYFLFFADRFGRLDFAEREYHYNLVLFQEIRRFWTYREQLGIMAVAANLLGNVVFFITFSGFGLSLCVEVIQLMTKLGCFDVDDLVMNTLGAAAGYVVFAVCHGIYKRKRGRK